MGRLDRQMIGRPVLGGGVLAIAGVSAPARSLRAPTLSSRRALRGCRSLPPKRRSSRVLKALKDEGRTVVAVHHDLSTVTAYFDRVVADEHPQGFRGARSEAFTADTLRADLRRTARGGGCCGPRGGGLTPMLFDALTLGLGYNASSR